MTKSGYLKKIGLVGLLLIFSSYLACSNFLQEEKKKSIDLLEHFPSMLKDMEDLHIYFGTADQAAARTINFSINEEHDTRKFSWMMGKDGFVEFYLAEPAKIDLTIHVRPFTPPGTPPQRLEVFLNDSQAGDHVLPLV